MPKNKKIDTSTKSRTAVATRTTTMTRTTLKHDVPFMVRLTQAERDLFERASREDGLQVSAWMRTVCKAAARARGLR